MIDPMNLLARIAVIFLATTTLAPMASSASISVSGARIAAKGSSGGAPPCASCHGPNGQGQAAAGFPRLAGLDAGYLARQLSAFASGARVSPVMGPVAKLLSADEQSSVAGHYAALPAVAVANEGSAAKPASPEGALLAQKGDWNHGLPACSQCHGPGGLGVGSSFPQLAGQSSAYLASQLAAWKLGTRKNDPMALMQGIATKLSDSQIAAVTDFYAGLPPATARSPKGKP